MALIDRQKELAGYLQEGFPILGLAGLPLKSACGEVGNATQENNCLPVTEGVKDHGSDGLMQWRLDRLTNMINWCTANFGDWKTIKAQAAFILFETQREYPSLWKDLIEGVKSLETLTANICVVFEKPDLTLANMGFVPGTKPEGTQKGRINFAYDIFEALGAVILAPEKKLPPVEDLLMALKTAIAAYIAAKQELILHLEATVADIKTRQEVIKQAQDILGKS